MWSAGFHASKLKKQTKLKTKSFYFNVHQLKAGRKGKGREKRDPPSTDLLPKCLQPPGMGLPEARSPKLHLSLLHGWQGPKYLRHHVSQDELVGSFMQSTPARTWTGTWYGMWWPNILHNNIYPIPIPSQNCEIASLQFPFLSCSPVSAAPSCSVCGKCSAEAMLWLKISNNLHFWSSLWYRRLRNVCHRTF